MNYEEFEEMIINLIKERVDENARISLHRVCKNNGIKLTGLVIMNENECISPTIYLEPFYETACKGEDLENIVSEIIGLCCEQRGQLDFDVEDFQNVDSTKKKIFYKLINYEKNKELLETVPHRRWKDLAIVYYVLVSCNELGLGTILVKKEHLKYWKVSEEDLFEFATANTPTILKKELKSMAEIIIDFMEEKLEGEDAEALNEAAASTISAFDGNEPIKMYVMGNCKKLNGACAILYENVLAEFAEFIGNDFYILPSSIHEVILVPADEAVDEASLLALVREVNEKNVSREEWLSDNIYKYIKEAAEVEMIS